ncbi:MAG: sugar kinase, partial [Deltaproteobacteria bacterium]|nr:sugar kinase [Deltaproteobacteria bacterium]
YGALLFADSFFFSAPGFPLEDLKDPTGAGDSFAGGFIGFLAKKDAPLTEANLKHAVVCGSAMASFQVEDFGLERMRKLTKKEIQERFQAFKKLSHFEETLIL